MTTDKPTLIIQNCPVESAGTTRDYLRLKQKPFLEIHTYRGETLPDPDTVGAVINLGCPHPAARYHEHEHLKDLFSFVHLVTKKNHPYLGLCFGGQILALTLGAAVTANPVKEIGVYHVSLTEQGSRDPLFRGFDNSFQVFHWHNDTFTVPASAGLLARGEDGSNQVFVDGRAYAMIFHLEVDPEEVPGWCDAYREELVELGKTGDEVIEAYRAIAARTRALNFRLLDNFFALSEI